MMRRQEYRLPNRTSTTDALEYEKAWKAIGNPIAKEFGLRFSAFDPDLQFILELEAGYLHLKKQTRWVSVSMPLWFAEKLSALIKEHNKLKREIKAMTKRKR